MKLLSMRLENFRQFAGQHSIQFGTSNDRNVTLIFGANGSGKTTVLNAFTWCLYGSTTPAFANPDNLIAESVVLEAHEGEELEGSVTVRFDHEGQEFIATRIRREVKTGDSLQTRVKDAGLLELQVIGSDGRTRHPKNPEERLGWVLPERLHSFFFFDGERIERLLRDEAYEKIEEAIKSLLGLEILDRAVYHLTGKWPSKPSSTSTSTLKSRLNKDLKKVGNPETQAIVDEIHDLNEKLEAKSDERNRLEKNKEELDNEMEAVGDRLLNLEETSKLQENLRNLEEKEKTLQDTLRNREERIRTLISEKGFHAFTQPILSECEEVLERSREKGEIPAKIKKQFVQDLLERARCICGAHLPEGSDAYESVASWLDKAGLEEVEVQATSLASYLKPFGEHRAEFWEDFDHLIDAREETRNYLEKTRERMSQINHRLGEKDSEEAQDLIQKKNRLREELERANEKMGALKQDIVSLEEKIREKEKKREAAEEKSEKARIAQKRLKVVGEVGEFFRNLYELRSSEVREDLDERVKNVYQSISFKDYWPVVTEDYRLLLKKGLGPDDDTVSQDVAKSTGESQILSLSFIGSVAAFAREVKEKGGISQFGFEGGVYPMVMDSPFGSLDDNYRGALAEGIPRLSDQVVVMVSKSQGLGPVMDGMKGRIAKSYVLACDTTKADQAAEDIELNGRSYPYIREGAERDSVELLEVTH